MATVTERGSGGNNTAATTLVINPSGTLAVGSMGVLVLALDNAGSGGATAAAPSSITDSKGNVWTRRRNPIYDPGAASAGVEIAGYTAPITTALLATDNITVTWAAGVSVTAKAWALKEIVPAAGNSIVYVTGADGTGAASGAPTITTSSITSGDVVIGWGGAESADTWAGDADTSNGSWSAHVHAGFGSGTSGMSLTTQHKIVTATATQTYNPTLTSADQIIAWMQVTELAAKTGSETPAGADASTEVGSYVPTDAAAGADVSNRVSDKSCALVVGDSANLTGLDGILRGRLLALGYNVFIVDDGAAADLTRDLVVIAESISSVNVTTKYRNASMPVINLDHALNDDFDFISVGSSPGGNEDNIVILDAAHGLAGGNSGTVLVQPTAARIDSSNTSVLAASVQNVYSLESSSTEIVGYGFEAGAALLNSHTAEARRVFIGLFPEVSGGFLNATGLALFDAAVVWAGGVATTPKTGADPGSGADVSAETGSYAPTDGGSGADASSPAAVFVVTDAGSGAEAAIVIAPAPATADSASGAEAATETASLTRSETPTGSDVSAQGATAPATADTGSGSDTGTAAAIAATSPETGSGADASSEVAVYARTDAAAGTDVSSASAVLLATDAATGADASTVTQGAVSLQGTDSGAGVDASAIAAAYTSGEPASAADGSSLVVSLLRTDAAAGADVSAITRLYQQSESGVGAELAAMTAKFVATDTGVGTDDSVRIGGRFVAMVRAMLAAAVPAAKQDPSDAEPAIFRAGTLYVWEEDDRRSPAAQGRQDFIIRAVYVAGDRGERAGLPRSRSATVELGAAQTAMLDAVRLAYAAGVWEYATATVDPTLARAYGVRGIGLRIAGYRLL